jgi:hypothetical protein
MVVGDAIKIPVNITNLGTTPVTTRLTETASNGTIFRINPFPAVTVLAGQTVQTFLTATALVVNSAATLNVVASGNTTGNKNVTASTSRTLSIVEPVGVRRTQVRGAIFGSNAKNSATLNSTSASLTVNLTQDVNQSSSQWTFAVFPSVNSILDASINAVSSLPQGNFEQVASSLYPVFLKFQALNNQNKSTFTADQQVQFVSLQYGITSLVQQLLTYRVQEGNFTRYNGQDLSNEGMTAFALNLLVDLQNVTTIDQSVIASLSNYLLSRRNGRGGFLQSFSNPLATAVPEQTLNAYILNALAGAGVNSTVAEVNATKAFIDAQLRVNQADGYILAQLAQALFRLKRTAESTVYADALQRLQAADGSVFSNQTTTLSVLLSNGTELALETTAIAIQVWSTNPTKYITNLNNAAAFLAANNNNGLFGNAHATAQALKALNVFYTVSGFPTQVTGTGNITLSINGVAVQTIALVNASTDAIRFDASNYIRNNSRVFAAGSSINFGVAITGFNLSAGSTKDFKALFSVSHRYIVNGSYAAPAPLNLTTDFQVVIANARLLGGDNSTGRAFPVQVLLQNVNPVGSTQSGQLNVVLNPPACLVLDEMTMGSLVSSGAINGYQTFPSTGQIVVFVNSLMPGQVKTVQLPYVQRFAGVCAARDNMVYQAYGDFELYARTRLDA